MEEHEFYNLPMAEHFSFCPTDNIHIHHVLMRQQEWVTRNEEDETSNKGVDAKPG
ncbi:MAG: hypothetical protein ABSG71_04755 [Thermodesulfobacteriota bacterium]